MSFSVCLLNKRYVNNPFRNRCYINKYGGKSASDLTGFKKSLQYIALTMAAAKVMDPELKEYLKVHRLPDVYEVMYANE